MHIHIRGRCERVRQNNGIIQALFTKQSDQSVPTQEEHVLVNLVTKDLPVKDRFYRIEIVEESN